MEVAAGEGTAYAVDANSTVTWTGSKPTGKHDGIFKISNGSLTVKDSTLTGGNFTIDINSISNTDLAGDTTSKAQLEGHLKSADFFDVAKFPTAKFEITAVEPYVADNSKPTLLKDATHTIKGNLTLKDSTKNVAFPAKIMIDATGAKAVADFNIDRTLWGLNYKGPNNPQDWVISKEVNIKLNISAAKK
ncbi:MAG: YceI family protein [Pedobacter sp.]|nr:MAG: YceI family protein [Pedobacter sp.]